MLLRLFKTRSVAGNARALNIFSFWFCLRFYGAVAVIYFAHVTHSYLLAASIFVISRVAQGVLEVPTGIISDRLGRVWCLRIGALASLLSMMCYTGGQYWWLVAGAVLDGLWEALFSGNNEALLYESAKEEGRLAEFAGYLGRVNVAMEVGGFMSVMAGGFLAALSFQLVLWMTAATQLMALVAAFWLVEPRKHSVRAPNVWVHLREAFVYMKRNATLRRLSLGQIMEGGFSTFELWPAFYNQLLPVWAVGAMVSMNYLESAIGFHFSGWFIRRFAARKIILASGVYSRLLMLPAVLFPSPASPALMAAAGAPYGPDTVAKGTLMHQEFTDHQRATMASINSVLSSCVYTAFALVVGMVADRWGVGTAILTGQICLLPPLWLYWRVYKNVDIVKTH